MNDIDTVRQNKYSYEGLDGLERGFVVQRINFV